MAKQNEFENDFTPELLDNAVLCGMSVVGQDGKTGAIICAYSQEPEKSLNADTAGVRKGFAFFDVKNGIKRASTAYHTLVKNMTSVYFDARGQFRAEFRRQFNQHTGDNSSLRELDGVDVRNVQIDTPLNIQDVNNFFAEVFGRDPYFVKDLSRRAEMLKQVTAQAGITTNIDDVILRARQSNKTFMAGKLAKEKSNTNKEKEMGE